MFVVSFCLRKDIHKLRLRRNLNFLDPPLNPTQPDHEKPGKTARRTWSGKKRKQKWLRALRLGVNTIQPRRSVRKKLPPKWANFEHVEKTRDKDMIPPKESRKDLMLSQSGRVVLCSCHVSF